MRRAPGHGEDVAIRACGIDAWRDPVRARRRAVFLSSHILSEVEALCDPGRHPPRGPAGGTGIIALVSRDARAEV